MSLYDFEVESITGDRVKLEAYRGAALLIVNVASRCGFTPQYQGLESLYRRFRDSAFFVLGFPSNQFGAQEPGDSNEIRTFCKIKYDVTFPLFAKIEVNGPGEHPLYRFLKSEKKGFLGEAIKWNFTKFLTDRAGNVVRRYGPWTTPEAIAPEIERLLAGSALTGNQANESEVGG